MERKLVNIHFVYKLTDGNERATQGREGSHKEMYRITEIFLNVHDNFYEYELLRCSRHNEVKPRSDSYALHETEHVGVVDSVRSQFLNRTLYDVIISNISKLYRLFGTGSTSLTSTLFHKM